MGNDDSWVSALEYAIEQNIKHVPEICNLNKLQLSKQKIEVEEPDICDD